MDVLQGSVPGIDRSRRIDGASLPIATAPVTAATSDNGLATDRTDLESHLDSMLVVSRNVYSETQWMLPYLTSSLVVIVVHVYFLFRYATEMFHVIFMCFNGFYPPEGERLEAIWTPTEYMFTQTGVVYLLLWSYPFAGHAAILAGLTATDWAGLTSGAFGYYLMSGVLWLLNVLIYSMYTWIICWDMIDPEWKICVVILVTVVMCGLYVIVCLISRFKFLRWRGGD